MPSTTIAFPPLRKTIRRSAARVFQNDSGNQQSPLSRWWLIWPRSSRTVREGARSPTRIILADATLRVECVGRQKTYVANLWLDDITHIASPQWSNAPLYLGSSGSRAIWALQRHETGFSEDVWQAFVAHLHDVLPEATANAAADNWPSDRSDVRWWHTWTVLPLFAVGGWHLNHPRSR